MIEFKGSNEGIRMIIDASSCADDCEDLREALTDRLEGIGGFLSGARITAEITDERLSAPIAEVLTTTLAAYPDMTLLGIVCRPDEGEARQPVSAPVTDGGGQESASPHGPADWVNFHFGTVRGGQSVHSPRSLVVLGSVNPGGSVSALGNIYVVGNLSGVAHAGLNGAEDAWIYARAMNPLQLRIGEHLARSSGGEEGDQPECAIVEDGRICVYPARRLRDLADEQAALRGISLDMAGESR